MRPQHPADGTNHVQDPRLRGILELASWYTLLTIGLVVLMVAVAGAVDALGYR